VIGASFPRPIAQTLGAMSQLIGLGRFRVRLVAGLTSFLAGLTVLRQPGRTLVALAQTGLVWGLNGVTYWAGLVAFGLTAPGFLGALFTQSVTALAIAIPSTPGAVGPLEAGIRFSLSVYSIPVNTILGYAIALRVIVYVTIPIIAAFLLYKLNLFQKLSLTNFSEYSDQKK
jgi:glycosyltransferase 2 family protein